MNVSAAHTQGDHADGAHDYAHHHHADGHHGHSHGPEVAHPPSAVSVSILRLSLTWRLAIAALASVALWGAVWLAMQ